MKIIKWYEILTDNGDLLCFDTFDLFGEWKNDAPNKWKQKYRSNYKTRDSMGKHQLHTRAAHTLNARMK